MRHLFLLFLFLLAPLASLHSAQEPLDAAVIAELRSDAEQGHAEAQFSLGWLYHNGDGVAQDYVKARDWYLKAAEQGHAEAQSSLGGLYVNGHGVAQNYTMAYVWFNSAAAQGNTDAKKNRDAVAGELDDASLSEAQKLSKEYIARKAQRPRREQEQHNQPFEASSKDSLPDLDEQSGRKDKGKRAQTLPGLLDRSPALSESIAVYENSTTYPMLQDEQVEQLLVEAYDLMKRDQYEDAMRAFKEANRKSGGDCEDCLLGLAKAFNKMGAFKNAAKEARRAAEASTYLANRIHAYNELGLALFSAPDNKKSLEEAEQAFTKILELSEGDSNMARSNLAHILLRLKRDTEARALLQEFIDYDPESATADRARAILKNPRRAIEPAAPDFSMVTLDGEYLTSEDLQGKVVLLDFWATWCAPCRTALPALRRLSKKMKKDPFVLISLSSEDEGVIRAFVEANGMNWPHYRDERGHFFQELFQARTLPTYVLIDHEGIIVFRSTGWSSSRERALTSRVSKAIKTARKAQPPLRE